MGQICQLFPSFSLKCLIIINKKASFLLRLGVPQAIMLIHDYPELWILRYPAYRYYAVPSLGFEPTTLWLRVRHPNHLATTLQKSFVYCRTTTITTSTRDIFKHSVLNYLCMDSNSC
jgi:hypothetical protein